MIQSLGLLTNPEDTLKHRLALPDLLHFEYRHEQSYRDDSTLQLTVVLKTPELECLITPSSDTVTSALQQYSKLTQISSALNIPILKLNAPLPLAPLEIEKPWGKEVWFTGIEQRGYVLWEAYQYPGFSIACRTLSAEIRTNLPFC